MPASTVHIRQAEPWDVGPCTSIYVRAYEAPPYDGCFDDETAAAILRQVIAAHPATCFVALEGGQLLGFILCSTLAGMKATIEEFAVDPDRQREGIGKALLDHALRALRQQGFTAAELIAHRRAPAFRFYRGYGFRESGSFALMAIEL